MNAFARPKSYSLSSKICYLFTFFSPWKTAVTKTKTIFKKYVKKNLKKYLSLFLKRRKDWQHFNFWSYFFVNVRGRQLSTTTQNDYKHTRRSETKYRKKLKSIGCRCCKFLSFWSKRTYLIPIDIFFEQYLLAKSNYSFSLSFFSSFFLWDFEL